MYTQALREPFIFLSRPVDAEGMAQGGKKYGVTVKYVSINITFLLQHSQYICI